jgi:hypothetical protein
MGILLAFFAGWATASKAGSESHDEVVAALKAVRDSQEVADLLAALRGHAGFAFRELGNQLLDSGDGPPLRVPDIVARVRAMIVPPRDASPAS